MERSADETFSSRVRALAERISGPWEVALLTAVAIITWWIALGWDWSSVPSTDPLRSEAPQSGPDWLILAIVIAAAVGRLAWRGYGVAGTVSIALSIVVLSGWRLSVSGILGWPIDLATLIFMTSSICIVSAALGTGLRHHADHVRRDQADCPDEPTYPEPPARMASPTGTPRH
jgi:hypothetical protein